MFVGAGGDGGGRVLRDGRVRGVWIRVGVWVYRRGVEGVVGELSGGCPAGAGGVGVHEQADGEGCFGVAFYGAAGSEFAYGGCEDGVGLLFLEDEVALPVAGGFEFPEFAGGDGDPGEVEVYFCWFALQGGFVWVDFVSDVLCDVPVVEAVCVFAGGGVAVGREWVV